MIIADRIVAEGFDLPQRGRRPAYLLTVARERGAVFIGFYKKVLRVIARFYGFPSAEGSFKGV